MSVENLLNKLEAQQENIKDYDELFIPLSLRLERSYYAFLLALSKEYGVAKAAIATDLLKEAINDAMAYLGKDRVEKMLKQGEKELDTKKGTGFRY